MTEAGPPPTTPRTHEPASDCLRPWSSRLGKPQDGRPSVLWNGGTCRFPDPAQGAVSQRWPDLLEARPRLRAVLSAQGWRCALWDRPCTRAPARGDNPRLAQGRTPSLPAMERRTPGAFGGTGARRIHGATAPASTRPARLLPTLFNQRGLDQVDYDDFSPA